MDGVTHWPVYLCESSILITKACVCNFTDLESNRGARNTHETLSGMSELYELVINQSELNAVLADRGRAEVIGAKRLTAPNTSELLVRAIVTEW